MLCCAYSLSHVLLFAIPWNAACQTSLPRGILQARIMEGVAFPFSGGSSHPGIKPRPQAGSLPESEPQGNPKSTGVGSLFLLPWIFLTQESNQDLLHCRWILYQLSYQGSPYNIFLYSELAIHSILHSLFHVKYEIHNLTSNFCPCAPTTVQISLLRKLI